MFSELTNTQLQITSSKLVIADKPFMCSTSSSSTDEHQVDTHDSPQFGSRVHDIMYISCEKGSYNAINYVDGYDS